MCIVHDLEDLDEKRIPFPIAQLFKAQKENHTSPDHKSTIKSILLSWTKMMAEYIHQGR